MELNITKFNKHQLNKYTADEDKAFELLIQLRWNGKPKCVHCGNDEKVYVLNVKKAKRKVLKCSKCRKQFSALIGTIFEGSHIPLSVWLQAIYSMCSSKKGVAAYQLHRELGITYKSAWFMCHRIRHAMTQEPLKSKLQGAIEVDETYVGGKGKGIKSRGRNTDSKTPVVTVMQRDGDVRSFKVNNVKSSTLKKLISDNVDVQSDIYTDSFKSYKGLDKTFNSHETVDHSKKEYARGIIHVNFSESYNSLLKRGLIGTFHHISYQHLDRYLSEFDFKWNTRHVTDGTRMIKAVKQIEGKRLMYKEPLSSET